MAFMHNDAPFGKHYLQDRLTSEFALVRHIGIVVESADDSALVLSAPLMANANYQGTAFGGSLFSVAVLTGWAWVARYVDSRQLAADAVIQESTIRYRTPVRNVLRASLVLPEHAEIERFAKMLQRARRGRIRLRVEIREGPTVAAEFEGVYAATSRL
jgi:thioesterase domain-containing protein